MCLYKDKKKHPFNRPLVADKDIVCYKKLDFCYFTWGYMTPCTHSQIPTKCLRKKVPFKAEIVNKAQFIWKHILGFSDVVTDGFIHSYAYTPSLSFRYDTFKCIIPKGTKYFIGVDHDYASEQIIFIEKLK